MSELCKCGHPMAVHGEFAGCMAPAGSSAVFCPCEIKGDADWDIDLRDRPWSQGGTPAPTEPTPCPDCARKDALLGRAKAALEYFLAVDSELKLEYAEHEARGLLADLTGAQERGSI
jgi:hypothetical protein